MRCEYCGRGPTLARLAREPWVCVVKAIVPGVLAAKVWTVCGECFQRDRIEVGPDDSAHLLLASGGELHRAKLLRSDVN